PGKYLAKVKSQSGKAVAEQEIEVLPGKLNRVEVVMAQEGVVKLIAVNEQGGKPLGDVTWQVNTIPTDLGKSELVSYGKGAQPEYKLLPGKYLATVKSTQGKAETEQEIEVLPGKKTTTEVVMAAEGILSLKAVHTAGGKAIKDVQWQLYTIVPADSMDKPSLVTYGKGSEPEYKLLPGKYTAIVKSNKGVAKVEQEVEVLASKRNQIEVIFPEEGEIQLSAVTEDGKSADRVYWEVFTLIEQDSIEKPERVKVGGGTSPLYRLLPGKYLARATVDREKYEKEIEVVAGKLTKDEIVLSKNG
ncbi:MAG: hypothetical protein KDD55_01445, partial [Bdellovibrionales bacterium]|nr:hypothetical protein [Bdellovibrionales bacterium]